MVLNQVSGRSTQQLKYTTLTGEEMVELLWDRFCIVSQNVPIRENFYYNLFMSGRRSSHDPIPEDCLPPYLRRHHFEDLKVSIIIGRGSAEAFEVMGAYARDDPHMHYSSTVIAG